MNIPKSIGLFDFSHALNVAFNAIGPDQAGATVLEQLASLRTACDHVVVCLDSKPYWRTTVFDGYKAGRKQDPELAQIWERTLQRVVDSGYNLARAANEEADDVMATLARVYSEQHGCEDVRLVTADKDIAQCVNDRVRWFVPQLGKRNEFEIRDAAWVPLHFGNVDWATEKQQKAGPQPSEVPMVQAICGDTSDRIPGVKGIGIKGAVALVKTYGTLAGMLQGLEQEKKAAQMKGKDLSKFWQNFEAGASGITQWLQLTTLRLDVKLDADPLEYLEKILPKAAELDDDDIERDAIQGEMDEELPGAPTADELEEERRTMAADLPVGIPTEPQREPEERRAAMAAEADRVMPIGKPMVIGKDPKADDVLRELAATQARASYTSTGPSAHAAKEPAAPVAHSSVGSSAPSQSAATQPAPAPASPTPSQVVSPRQGPQKPRDPDDLVENVQAVVPYAAPSWEMSTQPASAGQAFAIARKLHASKRWLSNYENPESIAAVILRGREMGVGMLTALDAFHVIKGKVCSSSQLLAALAERDLNHEYTMVVELTPKKAVVEIKHRKQPKPTQWTYTIEEAEALGLMRPSPKTGEPSQWVKRPQTMLLKTARANGHRFMFPAATLGMHSIETEVDAQHLVGDGDA